MYLLIIIAIVKFGKSIRARLMHKNQVVGNMGNMGNIGNIGNMGNMGNGNKNKINNVNNNRNSMIRST